MWSSAWTLAELSPRVLEEQSERQPVLSSCSPQLSPPTTYLMCPDQVCGGRSPGTESWGSPDLLQLRGKKIPGLWHWMEGGLEGAPLSPPLPVCPSAFSLGLLECMASCHPKPKHNSTPLCEGRNCFSELPSIAARAGRAPEPRSLGFTLGPGLPGAQIWQRERADARRRCCPLPTDWEGGHRPEPCSRPGL